MTFNDSQADFIPVNHNSNHLFHLKQTSSQLAKSQQQTLWAISAPWDSCMDSTMTLTPSTPHPHTPKRLLNHHSPTITQPILPTPSLSLSLSPIPQSTQPSPLLTSPCLSPIHSSPTNHPPFYMNDTYLVNTSYPVIPLALMNDTYVLNLNPTPFIRQPI